jgi:TolB-like protein/Flp pilus assembly protein TadD
LAANKQPERNKSTPLGIKGWLKGTTSSEQHPVEAISLKPTFSQFDKLRIAILPFTNISPDPSDEYFAEGMTEELISALSRIRELKVVSRTSAMHYKNTMKNLSEIAQELNVGSILEGSVRKATDDLRITVQLIDTKNDEHLWSEDYDRKLESVFAIQKEIAFQVTEALKIKLLASEKKDIERKSTESTQAYTLYLKGRYNWNKRTRDGIDKAVKYFEEAVKIDSRYAPAYTGLADCYVIYGDAAWLAMKQAFSKSEENARKAIEIDPRLSEAHASLGTIFTSYGWRWKDAEKEFKEAISLKPSYATAHHWYSLFLLLMNRIDDSFEEIKIAKELDPLSRIIEYNYADRLLFKNQYQEAFEISRRMVYENPDWPNSHTLLGFAYYFDSRIDESISEFRRSMVLSEGDASSKSDLACILGLYGREDQANEMLEELKQMSKTSYVPAIYFAKVLFSLGRDDEAFGFLETAYKERSATIDHGGELSRLRAYPFYSKFRNDSRWMDFISRLGLNSSFAE